MTTLRPVTRHIGWLLCPLLGVLGGCAASSNHASSNHVNYVADNLRQDETASAVNSLPVDLPVANQGLTEFESVGALEPLIDSASWNVEPLGMSLTCATILEELEADYRQFYDARSLGRLGAGLAAGAIFAHSRADTKLHDRFQSIVVQAPSDEWPGFLHRCKGLGDHRFVFPLLATAWGLGEVLPESSVTSAAGAWGERSLRGALVGGPALLLLQNATGGSRPGETIHDSQWRPLQDDNGLSGHSFVGALPFLTAAKMTDDKRWKTLFYAASTLAPLSRVNDAAHYPSQALLGWWVAYLAAEAVNDSELALGDWQVMASAGDTGTFLGITRRY